ncbi:MAG TPA: hypothetical protein VEY91_10720 [Candidatus Limnocylindria bacterium]|nr:hypothetical protein [Candidatus Limnocylindria bacterium]
MAVLPMPETAAIEPRPVRTERLEDIFAALDRDGVRHCLLRVPDEDGGTARVREVDVLVDPGDLQRFEDLVFGFGFAPLASWGRGGHRFHVAYDPANGEWLKLDVVTHLRFGGRTRPLSTPALDRCLERRRRLDGAFVPDVVDGVLGLLLHCILDKGTFRDARRREIEAMRAEIADSESLTAAATHRFEVALGRTLSWSHANACIASGAWNRLLERRREIAWTLFRRQPLATAARWLAGELMRFVRPILVAFRRRGFSVALLGPDGAGKTTVARALAEDSQIKARIVYMGSNPDAGTVDLPAMRWIGHLVDERRTGRDQTGKSGLSGGVSYANRLAAQCFRSLVALGFGFRGRFVVFDRHPCELLIAEPAHGRGSKLRRRLLRFACAKPDLVLLLDATPELLRSRKSEQSFERAARQRERYHSLPLAGQTCFVLDTSAAEEATVREAKSLIWGLYRQSIA